ncbi:MAG: hypothetical protein LBN93_04825 [Candidatus Symbiothrix sp.]|jgi:hypothetical protein|nr:hypothetical protein [Candidatus Symbiothrix sp.]
MKKRIIQILALFAVLLLSVGNVKAQTFQEITGETTYNLTNANISASDFITNSTNNWSGSKTYCGITDDFYNLSSSSRTLTITIKNVESFALSVHSSSNRHYDVVIGSQASQKITHSGGNCETKTFQTNDTGELTIVIKGDDGSVYPTSITFYPPTIPETPSIESFKIGEQEADIDDEEGTITATLPIGTDVSAITPAITLGGSALSYTPEGAQDFTSPVIYTVFDDEDPSADGAASKAYTVTLTVATSLSDDATLKDLQYNGETVAHFDPDTYSYDIELPYGSAVPEPEDVTAEKNYVNATVDAPERTSDTFPTDISVLVTAEDETATQTYTIHFTEKAASTDVSLQSLKVNGNTVTLVPEQLEYTVDLPYTTTEVPTVTAETTDANASKVIAPAESLEGQTSIEVTAEDGTTKAIYLVSFNLLPAPTAADDVVLYYGDATNSTTRPYLYNAASGAVSGDLANACTTNAAYCTPDGITTAYRTGDVTDYVVTLNSTTAQAIELKGASSGSTRTLTSFKVGETEVLGTEGVSLIGSFNNTSTSACASVKITGLNIPTGSVLTFKFSGNTKMNYLVVTPAPPTIASFEVNEVLATIEGTDITAELPYGTDLTAITPAITLGGSALSYTPAGAQDFTTPVTYTAYNRDSSANTAYTVTLTVALNDDATLSDLQYDGATVDGFDPAIDEYEIELPYGSAMPEAGDVTAVPTDGNASVGTPERTSDTFPTDITVLVIAEDETATQTYTIHFTEKAASTDVSLQSLKVNGNTVTLVPEQLEYTVDVPYTTTEVPAVEVETTDANATVNIIPATDLTAQTSVEVTAEDGTTKATYLIGFTVLVPTIESFKIGEQEADIDETERTITAELPIGSSLTAITPAITLGGSALSYTPLGVQDFTAPVTYTVYDDIDPTAIGAGNRAFVVTLTVAVSLSDDATLKDLKYKGETVTGFASDVYGYDIELPYGSAVPEPEDVTAEKNYVTAEVSAPERTANTFPTDISVLVTAEDGLATQTYTIHFTEADPSTDVTLKSLTVGGNAVTLVPEQLVYTVDLPYNATVVPTVLAEATDDNATVDIIPAADLTVQTSVEVTAEDGTTQAIYLIGFNLLSAPVITSFKIGEQEAVIDDELETITAELPYGSDLTALAPAVTLGGSALSYTPAGAQDFTAPVTYTAYDAETSEAAVASKAYTVTLTVALNDDVTLKSLTVGGGAVTLVPEQLEYTVNLPYTATAVPTVLAEATDANATVDITPAADLTAQTAIEVIAEDGTTTATYHVGFTVLPDPGAGKETVFLETFNRLTPENATGNALTGGLTDETGYVVGGGGSDMKSSIAESMDLNGGRFATKNLDLTGEDVTLHVTYKVIGEAGKKFQIDIDKSGSSGLGGLLNEAGSAGPAELTTKSFPLTSGTTSSYIHFRTESSGIVVIDEIKITRTPAGAPTGMDNVAADKVVKSVVYYDSLGRPVDADYKGFVIERIVYDDNSVVSRKIVRLHN